MQSVKGALDFSGAVSYHSGQFPPALNYERVMPALGAAVLAIGRYDGVLEGLPNSGILLAPLRRTEAVISSRMEGTVTTLDEILRFEADEDQDNRQPIRAEVLEVICYSRAMSRAQDLVAEGYEISQWLIRQTHQNLLSMGRGADKSPGEFKTEQNYVIDRTGRKVLFIPVAPEHLHQGMDELDVFMGRPDLSPLVQIALGHVEFEALHPFKDGNGRLGRMLITLNLWKKGLLAAPHFYISEIFDANRDQYLDRVRRVSADGEWDEWVIFFLECLKEQAEFNIMKSRQIYGLYEDMKNRFLAATNSRYAHMALDFVFKRPVFRNNQFVGESEIPKPTAQRFAAKLADEGLLTVLDPGAGRKPALYAFHDLITIVQPN